MVVALLAAVLLSGCSQPRQTSPPEGLPDSLQGSIERKLSPVPEAVIHVRLGIPPAGESAELEVRIVYESPGRMPLDTFTMTSGFTSPVDPGRWSSLLGELRWFDTPTFGYAKASIAGHDVSVPAPLAYDAYDTVFEVQQTPGRFEAVAGRSVDSGTDRREMADWPSDAPVFFDVVVSAVPYDPADLEASIAVTWKGGPLWIRTLGSDAIRSVRPSQAEHDFGVTVGPAQVVRSSEFNIELGGSPNGTLTYFVPPVRTFEQDSETYYGTAFVEPPGEDRYYLESWESVWARWITAPGTWTFGQNETTQGDRWDRALLVAIEVPMMAAPTEPPTPPT